MDDAKSPKSDLPLRLLKEENISALDEFERQQASNAAFFSKVEAAHAFLDQVAFKIKESRCRMDKDALINFLFDFIKRTQRIYKYHERFVASLCKTLVTFHRGRKDLDRSIEVLEYLISLGITEDEPQPFHIQLDELYRLRRARLGRAGAPPLIKPLSPLRR